MLLNTGSLLWPRSRVKGSLRSLCIAHVYSGYTGIDSLNEAFLILGNLEDVIEVHWKSWTWKISVTTKTGEVGR